MGDGSCGGVPRDLGLALARELALNSVYRPLWLVVMLPRAAFAYTRAALGTIPATQL